MSCRTSCTYWCAGASPAAAIAHWRSSSSDGATTSSPGKRPELRMTALTARIAEDFASSAASEQAGAAARHRAVALKALETAGLPSSRDENWKYANLRSLERVRFLPAPAVPALPSAADLPAALPGIARLVFIDGHFAPAHSATPPVGAATVTLLSQAADGRRAEADGPRTADA